MTDKRRDLPPWRRILGVAGLSVGLLLLVLAWIAAEIPVNRSVPPQAYYLLGASLVIGLVVIGGWALGQRRPEARARRSWLVIAVVLVVAFSASTLMSISVIRLSYARWVTDLGAVYTACGPFGVFASHRDHQALAAVRQAFPGYRARIATGCRASEDGSYLVEVAVGPFTVKGLPTRLVVDERVSDSDLGGTGLIPYASPAEAVADLPRLDADPKLRHAMGQTPRVCVLEVGDGGFGPDAFMRCLRRGYAPAASPGPTPWPPPVPEDCSDGPFCVEVDLALPRAPARKPSGTTGDHRHLTTFAHTTPVDGSP